MGILPILGRLRSDGSAVDGRANGDGHHPHFSTPACIFVDLDQCFRGFAARTAQLDPDQNTREFWRNRFILPQRPSQQIRSTGHAYIPDCLASDRRDRWLDREPSRQRSRLGLFGNVVVGIVGAVVAGWLLPLIGFVFIGGIFAEIINAVIGAVPLLVIIGLVQQKTA
jgi:uncharacterized membrane protein YeaQ/YmgE (transglycosylase-associated protein family)